MLTRRGVAGWVILAAWVVFYDNMAHRYGGKTLSDAFWVSLAHPRKRWLVVAAWSVVSAHLLGKTPLPLIIKIP